MKIEATCGTCERRFILSQIGPGSDSPNRCPFCGTFFANQYSSVLPGAVADAEEVAAAFMNALERLEGMDTGFNIDIDDLLIRVRERLLSTDQPAKAS